MKTLPKLFLAVLLVAASSAQAAETFWLSFSEAFGVRKFVMRFTQDGAVLQAPVEVLNFDQIGKVSGATAIWKRDNQLFLWTPAEFDFPDFPIGRAIIDLNSWDVDFDLTNLNTSDPSFLQAAMGGNGRVFLAYEENDFQIGDNEKDASPQFEDNGTMKAAETNANGMPTSNRWRLSPRTDNGNDQGSVATDGRMAVSNDHDSPPDKIYGQPLTAVNFPSVDPKIFTNYENTSIDIDSLDVSNHVANGWRFAVYQVGNSARGPNTAGVDPSNPSIVLQRISATTGKKVGKPVLLSDDFRFDFRQVIAVGDNGSVVAYTSSGDTQQPGVTGNGECEKILLQKLKINGKPDGSPIELVDGCDLEIFAIMGLDLVRE